jgi:hypothetical protein
MSEVSLYRVLPPSWERVACRQEGQEGPASRGGVKVGGKVPLQPRLVQHAHARHHTRPTSRAAVQGYLAYKKHPPP